MSQFLWLKTQSYLKCVTVSCNCIFLLWTGNSNIKTEAQIVLMHSPDLTLKIQICLVRPSAVIKPNFNFNSKHKHFHAQMVTISIFYGDLLLQADTFMQAPCNWKLFILFLNQNICCGYSKEPSHWDASFEHPKHMFKLIDKKIIAILRWNLLLNWPYVYRALFHWCLDWTLQNAYFNLFLFFLLYSLHTG